MQPGSDPTRRIPDSTRRLDPPRPGGPDAPTDRFDGYPVLGGRYRLEGLLGAGGMADVHRAEDLRLGRPVAVKVFRPGTDPDGAQRFREEAQILANLRHPGLVAVHDFAVEDGRAYLVMELVDGPTLAQELERERYDATAATQVGLELARVLAYVHDEGVVHRDVKPSNILIESDGRVRLTDFGISRLIGASGLTSADSAVGTAGYLSPEQVRGEQAGPPADVYALGLVLLEALTGRREYAGDDWETADERLRRAPDVPTDTPEPLRSTLRAMTATEPGRRPDAREVAARLGRPEVLEPDAPPRSRAPWIALAVVALLVLVGIFALTRSGEETDPTAAPPSVTEEPAEPTAEPATEAEPPPETEAPPEAEAPVDDEPSDPVVELPEIPTALPDLPDLPSNLPDVPTELPDLTVPSDVQDDARNLWQQFTDWVSSLF